MFSRLLVACLFLCTASFACGDDADELAKLLKSLKGKTVAERAKAAADLGKLGEKATAATKDLCLSCLDTSETVRIAALESLEKIAPDLYPHIVILLAEPDLGKQKQTYKELAEFQQSAAPVAPLMHAVLRRYLVKFRKVKGQKADPRPNVIAALALCADTLATIAPDEATATELAVLAMLDEQEYNYRFAIRGAVLGAIETLAFSSNAACHKPVMSVGVHLLSDPLAGAKIRGLRILMTIGPEAKASLPAIKKLKLAADEDVRKAAAEAIEAIEK